MRIASRLRRGATTVLDRAAFEVRQVVPPATRRDYRRFIILGQARSGSTMLVERCASHPAVTCYGELLAPARIDWLTSSRAPLSARFLAARERDPIAFLTRQVWHRYSPEIGAVGFKLLYGHFLAHREKLAPLLSAPGDLRILWLQRRNRFETYLSLVNGQRSNVYYLGEDAVALALPALRVDVVECRRFLNALELMTDLVPRSFAGLETLKLFYEDLVADADGSNHRVCAFLGVPDMPLRHSARKMARGPLSQRVANLDELRSCFRGSRWENCFEDG